MICFRKLLITIAFLAFQTLTHAQQEIPNGDFESWPPNNFGNPEFWDSPNEERPGFRSFSLRYHKQPTAIPVTMPRK